MVHIERTFTVRVPVEKAFAYLSDFENTNEWDPGTVETKRISGDGGIGTIYANKSEFMGREVELTYETVGYLPGEFFSARGRNKTATATDSMMFDGNGDGTEIQYRAEFEFHGILKHIAPFIVRPKLGALADETVEQITKALET